ncbi:gamma-glutamyltransferase family protein [Isoptericola sp. b441]|uniref:Gamma-glutamyltransferase family protein n=1 Tax=Actinotalea lenta TaxID=3064654 RepID=A0ABT9DBB1_9CELL|nr:MULTISPECIES: gamma-glutamyltransferase family protein [unclassified Isoptericola]MDO8108187.1 gamma-glutamyltransferase family protein [Isoptericola sp. b441]MDO8120142.1 gamma-glutamyltransferase family protein [Isoptericola sp. b490]
MPGVTTRPEIAGTLGVVASSHWLASTTGMGVLERGGNAFDAAVAAGLVLHVVEPHLNGLGGDVPLVGCRAGGEPFVLCGQGTSPAAATPEAFTELGLDVVPGTGYLAAVVPGAFGTWMDLLARYGTWHVRDVLEPAIGYAADGHPLLPAASAAIGRLAPTFTEHWTSSARTWLPQGEVPPPGSRFRNPVLARTLQALVREAEAAGVDREAQIEAARTAFYSGFVAERIADAVREPAMDSSGTAHAGLLTADDLATWRVREEPPVTAEVFGRTIAKTGPWGQGPVLLQQLLVLEGMDLADTLPTSAELIHTVVESTKLALADRDAWYGDPDHTDVPLDTLLSREYADQRRRLIGSEASAELRPGSPDGRTPRLPRLVLDALDADGAGTGTGRAAAGGTGEPTFGAGDPPRGDTCHLDVVDRWGNTVAVTPSGGWLQSSPVIPGLGFALPTRAQMFWLEPGLATTLGPRRRPRTTLSPTLVLRDGTPELACGTPGGDMQDQWQVPFLLRHLLGGRDLQAAIDGPMWHTTHHVASFEPRTVEVLGLHVEERVGADVIADLRRRGHRVTVTGPWSLGRLSAAGTRPDGLLHGGATSRGAQAYAVGR